MMMVRTRIKRMGLWTQIDEDDDDDDDIDGGITISIAIHMSSSSQSKSEAASWEPGQCGSSCLGAAVSRPQRPDRAPMNLLSAQTSEPA